MNSKRIRKITALVIAVLVLIYVGYQFYVIRHKGLTTETATYASVSDTVQAKGFAIREEQVIEESYNGVLSYHVGDGEKVSNGGVIADVYASEADAAAQLRIDQIDSEIENLEVLTGPTSYFSANPSLISSQIYSALGVILDETRNGDYTQISAKKEDLLNALNRKLLITGEESAEDYQQRISQLKSEKSSLEASTGQAIDTINAPVAGYFISSIDGFENVLDMNAVTSLTPDRIKELQDQEETSNTPSSNPIGKICSDYTWYLACVFSKEDMVKFENITSVTLEIPYSNTPEIPATIVARNQDPETEETAVIFECSYMDSGIAQLRNELVQVNVKTYSGVLVRKEALHFCDVTYTTYDEDGNPVEEVAENVKGVYVKYGGRLKFVQVFTEKTINGYAICKTDLSEEEKTSLVTASTIQLYDEVVVEGTDLYDGKIVQ